jgi:hypothetical protein
MIGFISTSVTSFLNPAYYRTVADIHNFQSTVAHALGFPVLTSHLPATDLNTETNTSNHWEVFLLFRLQFNWIINIALQPFVVPWPLFQFLTLYTQSIVLLGRGISPSQGPYLHREQHRHRINAHRHPCLEWDSTLPSQCSSGEDSSCQTAQPLWSVQMDNAWAS